MRQVELEHGEVDDPDGVERSRASTVTPPLGSASFTALSVTPKAPCRSAYFLASSVRSCGGGVDVDLALAQTASNLVSLP